MFQSQIFQKQIPKNNNRTEVNLFYGADNANKIKYFLLKINIYQILCQLKYVIIKENMDAVWNDVIQPRRVPLHDESVHNAIINKVLRF